MMAGFADQEYLRDVEFDPPVDDGANPQADPGSPSVVPPADETLPVRHVHGSSTAPNLLEPAATFNAPSWSQVGDVGHDGSEGAGKISGGATSHTNDLATAQSGLLAGISAGQFSGAALGHVQAILSDITTAISAVNASVSSGSTPGAEQTLLANHLSILNTVSTDPVLANPAGQKTPTEPVAAPEADSAAKPDEKAAATAPDANAAETSHLAEAGDTEHTAQIDDHLDASVVAEMEALIAANPDMFVGLTVKDAEEIVQQIEIELSHVNKGDLPPGSAPNSSGDITNIVTGDINLASLTAQGPPNSPEQHDINIVGASETQASPPVAVIATDDAPVIIATTEAPTIVDHSNSGMSELAHQLHHTWG
jgi:hypothetical protein